MTHNSVYMYAARDIGSQVRFVGMANYSFYVLVCAIILFQWQMLYGLLL